MKTLSLFIHPMKCYLYAAVKKKKKIQIRNDSFFI